MQHLTSLGTFGTAVPRTPARRWRTRLGQPAAASSSPLDSSWSSGSSERSTSQWQKPPMRGPIRRPVE